MRGTGQPLAAGSGDNPAGRRSIPNLRDCGIVVGLFPLCLALLLLALAATLIACGGAPPSPPPSKPTIGLSPASLSFTTTAGGSNPANQTVTLSNTGTATLNFTATASSTPAGWLAVSPASGTVAAGGSTPLTVSVNSAGLAAGNFTASISVSDPQATNTPQSVSVSLTVNNPVPTLTSLSPSSVTAGGAAFTLTVTGTNFVSTSVVRWNGSDRTTFGSSTQLTTAAIPGTDIATAGSAQVTVFNSAPGGGTSNALTFTINSAGPFGVVERISVASDGTQGNGASGFSASALSADRRFVAFDSSASNLVASDTNAIFDVFVRDTCLGAAGCTASTVRVSVASDGTQGNGGSGLAVASASGRFVAFASGASNLVANDTNGIGDIFVRETCLGAPVGCVPSTVRVSVASDGTQANLNQSIFPAISADGRFVAFMSDAFILVANDTNFAFDIFVRDTCIGGPAGCAPSTSRVSVASDGSQGNGHSGDFDPPQISADGRFVAFQSTASNLVGGDTNGFSDVFVRDTCQGAPSGCTPSTVRLSVASDGTQGNNFSGTPSISADVRFVAFLSVASNLVPGDTNGFFDVFVHDRQTGQTTRVSLASDGSQGNGHSSGGFSQPGPAISADGRFVSFTSTASNLVAGDTNGADAFVRDTCQGAPAGCAPSTVRVSVASDGSQANSGSERPAISADGRFVAFESDASNLVAGDTNGVGDVFLAATGFAGAPVIITTSLPDGTLGTAYSATLRAVGGTLPFSWSIVEGATALPAGLSLNASTGVISGTPTTAGTFTFTVRVTDSTSPAQSDTQPLSFTVN